MLIDRIKSLFRREGSTPSPAHRPTGTHEAFLANENPELRDVVFSPLLPALPMGTIGSFDEMTQEWLREKVGDALYELGEWTRDNQLVKSVKRQGFYLYGEVASSITDNKQIYLVELSIMDGQLQGICSCSRQFDQVLTQGALPQLGAHFPPCKHIAAVLISYQKEYMQPTLERNINACICPVTRQALKPGTQIYLCQQCGTAYSAEGWEFLVDVDKARCCNCHAQNTVQSFLLPK